MAQSHLPLGTEEHIDEVRRQYPAVESGYSKIQKVGCNYFVQKSGCNYFVVWTPIICRLLCVCVVVVILRFRFSFPGGGAVEIHFGTHSCIVWQLAFSSVIL